MSNEKLNAEGSELCDSCQAMLEHRMKYRCPRHPQGCGLHDDDLCRRCYERLNAGRKFTIN